MINEGIIVIEVKGNYNPFPPRCQAGVYSLCVCVCVLQLYFETVENNTFVVVKIYSHWNLFNHQFITSLHSR